MSFLTFFEMSKRAYQSGKSLGNEKYTFLAQSTFFYRLAAIFQKNRGKQIWLLEQVRADESGILALFFGKIGFLKKSFFADFCQNRLKSRFWAKTALSEQF